MTAHCSENASYCKSVHQVCHKNHGLIVFREDTETVIHSDNDFATVAYLRIKNAVLEDKDAVPINPAVPSQLEERFEELHEDIANYLQSKQSEVKPLSYDPEAAVLFFASTSRRVDDWVVVSSIHRNLSRGMHAIPIEDEVTECFQTLKGPSHRQTALLSKLITFLRAPHETRPKLLPLRQH